MADWDDDGPNGVTDSFRLDVILPVTRVSPGGDTTNPSSAQQLHGRCLCQEVEEIGVGGGEEEEEVQMSLYLPPHTGIILMNLMMALDYHFSSKEHFQLGLMKTLSGIGAPVNSIKNKL